VPAVLREGDGEIEEARGRDAPVELVTAGDIRGTVHCHTDYSDGRQTIEQMARAAEALGMDYITITDHSPTASYANNVEIDRLARQWDEIARVQETVKVRILRGTESDILKDGSLDYPDRVLESFDVIVASIHNRYRLDERAMTARVMRAHSEVAFGFARFLARAVLLPGHRRTTLRTIRTRGRVGPAQSASARTREPLMVST
jgi:DNA polymerase (family 10)